jgi:hypothetical protein
MEREEVEMRIEAADSSKCQTLENERVQTNDEHLKVRYSSVGRSTGFFLGS